MDEPITVIIADDHGVVREGLRAMLEREGLRVVGEARNGREAIALTKSLLPDVVLLDIRMPDLDGLQALEAIKSACPSSSVIMLTSHANPGYLSQAVAHGAAGFLSKETDPDHIVAAVKAAATGEHLLDPALLRAALASAVSNSPQAIDRDLPLPNQLTDAEERVLRLVANGLNNDAIATALSLSVNTIKTHIRHIFEKLNVSDRTQAALWAVRHGLD